MNSDCTGFNLMMDGSALYPNGFHPVKQDHNRDFEGPAVQKYTRTQRPPRYYWIDFGLSVCSNGSEDPPLARPIWAGDKSAPELQHLFTSPRPYEPINPFPTDIYYLGNMVRMFFLEVLLSIVNIQEFNVYSKSCARDLNTSTFRANSASTSWSRWLETWSRTIPLNDQQLMNVLLDLKKSFGGNPLGPFVRKCGMCLIIRLGLCIVFSLIGHDALCISLHKRQLYRLPPGESLMSGSKLCLTIFDIRQPTIYLSIYAHVILAIWFISPLMVWYFSEFTMVPPSFSSLLNINWIGDLNIMHAKKHTLRPGERTESIRSWE